MKHKARFTAARFPSLGALAIVCLIARAQASPHNPDTNCFHDAGWGVFVHYL